MSRSWLTLVKTGIPTINQRRAASSGCGEPGPSRAELLRSLSWLRSLGQQNVNAASPEERPPVRAQTKIVFDYSPGPDSVSSVLQKKRVLATNQSQHRASLGTQPGRPPDCSDAAPLRTSRTSARQSLVGNEELALKPSRADGSRGKSQGTVQKSQAQSYSQPRQDEHRRCQNVAAPECKEVRQSKQRCPAPEMARPDTRRASNDGKTVKQRAASISECSFSTGKFPTFKELNTKRDKKDCKVTFGGETELASNEIYSQEEILDPSDNQECKKKSASRPDSNYGGKSKEVPDKASQLHANDEPKASEQKTNSRRWQVDKSPETACSEQRAKPGPRSKACESQPVRQETRAGARAQDVSTLYDFPTKLEGAAATAAFAFSDGSVQQQQPVRDKRLQVKCRERLPERMQEGSRVCDDQARREKLPGLSDANTRQKQCDPVQLYETEIETFIEVEVEQDSYCGNQDSKDEQANGRQSKQEHKGRWRRGEQCTPTAHSPAREPSQKMERHLCKQEREPAAARTSDAGTQTEAPGEDEPRGVEGKLARRSSSLQDAESPGPESDSTRQDQRSKEELLKDGGVAIDSWQPQQTPAAEPDIPEGCQEALQQDAERRRRQEAAEKSKAAATHGVLARGSTDARMKKGVGQASTGASEARPKCGQASTSATEARPKCGQASTSATEARPKCGQASTSATEARPKCGQASTSATEARPKCGQASTSAGKPVRRSMEKTGESMYSSQLELDQPAGSRMSGCAVDSTDIQWIRKGHLTVKLVNGVPTGSRVFSVSHQGHHMQGDIYDDEAESNESLDASASVAIVEKALPVTEEPEDEDIGEEQQQVDRSEPGSTGTEENGDPVMKPNKKCCC